MLDRKQEIRPAERRETLGEPLNVVRSFSRFDLPAEGSSRLNWTVPASIFAVPFSDARDDDRHAVGFNQRYVSTIGVGNRIDGYWNFSADGTNWRRDFDPVYTRA